MTNTVHVPRSRGSMCRFIGKKLAPARPFDSGAVALGSPSGKMSKAALARAQERIRRHLFGDGLPYPTTPQPSESERMLVEAKRLRELADRGMKPRAFRKRAAELEALAAREESQPRRKDNETV